MCDWTQDLKGPAVLPFLAAAWNKMEQSLKEEKSSSYNQFVPENTFPDVCVVCPTWGVKDETPPSGHLSGFPTGSAPAGGLMVSRGRSVVTSQFTVTQKNNI